MAMTASLALQMVEDYQPYEDNSKAHGDPHQDRRVAHANFICSFHRPDQTSLPKAAIRFKQNGRACRGIQLWWDSA